MSFSGLMSLVLIVSFQGGSAALEDAEAVASLDALRSWDVVLGMTEPTRDHPLEAVFVYSDDGTALVYPVEEGIVNGTDILGIVTHAPTTHDLVAGADYVAYTHLFHYSSLIMVAEDEGGSTSTLYEHGSGLALVGEHQIPFVPKHVSNLWNGYSLFYTIGRLALVLADDHNVWMFNKCPPPYFDPSGDSQTYVSNLTISDATIIGNPLVVDGDFENGSMVIVPTDVGLMAFDFDFVRSELAGTILSVSIGELRWMGEYSLDGGDFVPVGGDHAITFWYPEMPTTEIGKEYIALATDDSRVVAYNRVTGDIMWSKRVNLTSGEVLEIEGLHPSPEYLLATGYDGQNGYVVALDADTGEMAWNGTAIGAVDGRILSSPEYISGRYCYVLYTDSDMIFVYDHLMKSRFVYDFSDVGLSCIPRYLGNIYIEDCRAGNYIGVVTGTPELLICPFIEYAEDSDDWVDDVIDGPSWFPILAVSIAAAVIGVVALLFLLQKRGRAQA